MYEESHDVAPAPPAVLSGAVQAPALHFDASRRELLKRTLLDAETTDDELSLFAAVCERSGLDPFARQIYPLRDFNTRRLSFIASIDGFRLVTQRSGRYAGQTPYEWCGRDRVWREVWLPDEGAPVAARVGIHMAGFVEPLYAVAHWHEYAQTDRNGQPRGRWRTGGAQMLAKCAEALAHRRACPQELSGIYSAEEAETFTAPAPAAPDASAARFQQAPNAYPRPSTMLPRGARRDFTPLWVAARAAGISAEEVREMAGGDPGALDDPAFAALVARLEDAAADGYRVDAETPPDGAA